MNTALKNLLWLLCALPLLSKAHYIYRTWIDSPLERGGWVIWVCALAVLPLCEYLRRKVTAIAPVTAEPARGVKSHAGWFIAAMVAVAAGWLYFSFGASRVHALSILLALAFFYLATGLRFGISVFISQSPSLFFAVLATPSLSFWVGHYLEFELRGALSYLLAKLALGWLFLGLWSLWVYYKKAWPRLQSLLFLSVLSAILLFMLAQRQSVENGAPIRLSLEELQSGEWLARKGEVTQSDLNFFTGCTWISRMEYFDNRSSVSVLALEVADITNLHPMPICLKSGGAEILSSKQIYINVHGKPVQLNELEILSNGIRALAYSLYSNEQFSTGNFAKFRLLRKDRKIWYHYQLVTSEYPDRQSAQKRVESFLNTFAIEPESPTEK
ncbi:MAG: hypothetical protein QM428_09765 [Verrucomicrobiota bacterium]|nr:hypothetical protein [Verrucomicrobiota bacterium]